jgi:hypothetical protein
MSTKVTNGWDMNNTAITNLPDATAPQSPATLAQLNAAIQGWSWKTAVRAASTANITLSGLQTVDGVALVAGDRFLAKDQSAGATNGAYLVSASAWTRTTDMDTGAKAVAATFFVSEGTANGNTTWNMTTDAPITLGTTALVFAKTGAGTSYTGSSTVQIVAGVLSVVPGAVARLSAATIGDGTATTISMTHGLNTLDVVVSVREVSTGAQVIVDNVANGVNTVQFTFATAPTTGQYRAVVAA